MIQDACAYMHMEERIRQVSAKGAIHVLFVKFLKPRYTLKRDCLIKQQALEGPLIQNSIWTVTEMRDHFLGIRIVSVFIMGIS